MEIPETQIDPSNGQNVLVTWVEPYDNSDAIIEYDIIFKSAVDGIYYSTT